MAELNVIDLLAEVVSRGASDLHLTSDAPPMIRLHGGMVPLDNQPLGQELCRDLILSVISESQRAKLEENWELDFGVQVLNVGRFRGNAHYSRGVLEAAFRHIPAKIPDLNSLGHSEKVVEFCGLRSGMVLITGATGSGKSTTLAAMLKYISETMAGLIVTIEDPVEYVFSNSLSIVKQREVGTDTKSFASALKHVLRQDPDVIMVGELRDPETVMAAMTAAETGHLVLGSLHTTDAPGAIDRIVDCFPGDQQAQVIAQLASSLVGIVCQRLLPTEDGKSRVLASEILVSNTAVRATIRERRWEQLVGLMEIGARDGMHTIDESLRQLYQNRLISKEEAMANARDVSRIESLGRDPVKKGFFR